MHSLGPYKKFTSEQVWEIDAVVQDFCEGFKSGVDFDLKIVFVAYNLRSAHSCTLVCFTVSFRFFSLLDGAVWLLQRAVG